MDIIAHTISSNTNIEDKYDCCQRQGLFLILSEN